MSKKEISEEIKKEISRVDRDILQALIMVLFDKEIITENEIKRAIKNIKEKRIKYREEVYQNIADNRYGV